MSATRFPVAPVPGLSVYVGGRDAAEDEDFLRGHNIKFVLDATGCHNARFQYPLKCGVDFQVFKLPVGWADYGRDKFSIILFLLLFGLENNLLLENITLS